ncbi:MAG: hypothetical protein ACKPKO_42800, partial [Candidatus Fonsibacter sp.]
MDDVHWHVRCRDGVQDILLLGIDALDSKGQVQLKPGLHNFRSVSSAVLRGRTVTVQRSVEL